VLEGRILSAAFGDMNDDEAAYDFISGTKKRNRDSVTPKTRGETEANSPMAASASSGRLRCATTMLGTIG
jgi:hypothetical protein